MSTVTQEDILDEIREEREWQDKKWGVQKYPTSIWFMILGEEFGEVAKEAMSRHENKDQLRRELVQTAAVCVAWCEYLENEYKEESSDDS